MVPQPQRLPLRSAARVANAGALTGAVS